MTKEQSRFKIGDRVTFSGIEPNSTGPGIPRTEGLIVRWVKYIDNSAPHWRIQAELPGNWLTDASRPFRRIGGCEDFFEPDTKSADADWQATYSAFCD